MSMWGGFALWGAVAWERMPPLVRTVGAATVGTVGVTLGVVALCLPRLLPNGGGGWGQTAGRSTAWRALMDVPTSQWLAFRPVVGCIGVVLALFAALAIYFVKRGQQKLALISLALSMVPTGFLMIEGVAQMAPYFSLAGAARFLNDPPHEDGEVLYEGPLHVGSSLVFYLNRKFFLVNQAREPQPSMNGADTAAADRYLSEGDVLKTWGESEPVYLLLERDRVAYWQNLLTKRFHIYHQVMTCGTYVVLSNQF